MRNNLEALERPSLVSLGLWSNRRRLRLVQGLLCLTEASGQLRVVCPERLRLAVLERSHDKFGHMSVGTTMQLVRESFFWVSLRSDVESYVGKCGICCELKPKFYKHEDGVLITSSRPMERLSIDFVGPKMTRSGSPKWILTVVDEFTRFVEAFVMSSTTSSDVIRVLRDEVFSRYGLPVSVHSDRGPQLMSEEFAQYFRSIGVKLTHSSKYNPRGNGQCERYNGEIQRIMSRVLRQEGLEELDWEGVLPEVLWIMRSVMCQSTGKSPHEAFFQFKRRVFPDGDIGKLVSVDKIDGFPGDLSRGSPVFVRNFVRKSKSDPLVKGKGIVQDVLSPQLAEVLVDGNKVELLNTRHLAPRVDNSEPRIEHLQPGVEKSGTSDAPCSLTRADKVMVERDELPATEEGIPVMGREGAELGIPERRSGRTKRRPEKLDL